MNTANFYKMDKTEVNELRQQKLEALYEAEVPLYKEVKQNYGTDKARELCAVQSNSETYKETCGQIEKFHTTIMQGLQKTYQIIDDLIASADTHAERITILQQYHIIDDKLQYIPLSQRSLINE